jgi:hypothetical protein
VIDRFEVSGGAFATAVDVDGTSVSFAHLDTGGVRVELVEYDPAGEDRTGVDLNRPGPPTAAWRSTSSTPSSPTRRKASRR